MRRLNSVVVQEQKLRAQADADSRQLRFELKRSRADAMVLESFQARSVLEDAAFRWLAGCPLPPEQRRMALLQFSGKVKTNESGEVVEIYFKDERVTDAVLEQVSRLPSLEKLNLDRSCGLVTDSGLKSLSRTEQLEFLKIHNAQVTREAVQQLKDSLPHCAVHVALRPHVDTSRELQYGDTEQIRY